MKRISVFLLANLILFTICLDFSVVCFAKRASSEPRIVRIVWYDTGADAGDKSTGKAHGYEQKICISITKNCEPELISIFATE